MSALNQQTPSSSLLLQLYLSFSNPGLSLLYTLSPHPLMAGHITSPGMQLQLIREAGACLHKNRFACILVYLHRSHDGCSLLSGV